MKSDRNWLWILIGVVAFLFFADEIFGVVGAVLGLIFSVGFTGLVIVAMAAVAFAVAIFVGCSVGFAIAVAMLTLAFVLFSWLWPYLLVGLIIYLLLRKRPKPV